MNYYLFENLISDFSCPVTRIVTVFYNDSIFLGHLSPSFSGMNIFPIVRKTNLLKRTIQIVKPILSLFPLKILFMS